MKGLVIWIRTEDGSDEAILDKLGTEIEERGGRVEVFHSKNDKAKAVACAMLASHGVVVITSGAENPSIKSGEKLEIRIIEESDLFNTAIHDSFIRDLELAGLVPAPKYDVHPDEEKEILRKLQDLGYLDD